MLRAADALPLLTWITRIAKALAILLTLLNAPYSLADNGTTSFSTVFESFDECETTGTATCSAQIFFFDTATIDSIPVKNASGNTVPGATVTSLAGINYDSRVGVTPEPSNIVLLGTGMMSIMALIRSRVGRKP